jgi:hypothetical protein
MRDQSEKPIDLPDWRGMGLVCPHRAYAEEKSRRSQEQDPAHLSPDDSDKNKGLPGVPDVEAEVYNMYSIMYLSLCPLERLRIADVRWQLPHAGGLCPTPQAWSTP